MKRPNPDRAGGLSQESARTAARHDHGRPRLPPGTPARRAMAGPARPAPGQVTSGCPAHQRLDGRPEIKTTIRPGQASMRQTDGWLAELPDGESAGPAELAGPGYAVPASHGHAVPASPGHARPASYVRARRALAMPCLRLWPCRVSRWQGPAASPRRARRPRQDRRPRCPGRAGCRGRAAGPAGATVRAVIGDQLRMPVMWCEMGSCISWHADPAALGEADSRALAMDAGWRIDAFGRLACPRCQQANPGFRASSQVVPWDRHTAVARTARASRAAVRSSRIPGRAVSGHPRPARRSRNRTTISARPGPCPLAGGRNAQPAPAFPRCGAEMRPGPGRLAAAARHLAKPVRIARIR